MNISTNQVLTSSGVRSYDHRFSFKIARVNLKMDRPRYVSHDEVRILIFDDPAEQEERRRP
jgi:hypothetical protein